MNIDEKNSSAANSKKLKIAAAMLQANDGGSSGTSSTTFRGSGLGRTSESGGVMVRLASRVENPLSARLSVLGAEIEEPAVVFGFALVAK